jgi:uncharacterized surface protein with fasciclin (FAS1) repeats
MATRGAIVGAITLLALLTLTTGCTLRTGDGSPVTPASTGAGGAEETPSPVATTAQATPAAIMSAAIPTPTETPIPTPTPPTIGIRTPDETTATVETVVVTTPAPAPVQTGNRTIAELASADPELSRFAQALQEGGIYETLNGTGTYTVFAPTNAAFDAVPPGTLTRLLFDRDALAGVADYHVIYGRWLSADLARESSVATRSGVPLTVTRLPDGTLEVDDGAHVVRSDIVATNGVLHVVDAVMLPPGAL